MAGGTVCWRGDFDDAEVNALHGEAFGHPVLPIPWNEQVRRHSLGWVTARDAGQLVGFINVAWDGGVHAFLLDTMVARSQRRRGLGTQLVAVARAEARRAGCEWLHVDFGDELRAFYVGACGFAPTSAGAMALQGGRT